MKSAKNTIPEPLRRQLNQTHSGLLAIHKALLDYERPRYEAANKKIGSPGEFLQLLLGDPWFAWLRPISMLVAQIDEFVEDPTDISAGEALLKEANDLMAPAEGGTAFQQAYDRAMQDAPDVALAHSQWKRDLGQKE